MSRAFYSKTISNFLADEPKAVLGALANVSPFATTPEQRDAWNEEIRILRDQLRGITGRIFLEFSIPRMGKRIDALVLVGKTILILEFKVGERSFTASAFDQAWDYSLDLKNFHETSHHRCIVPTVVATEAKRMPITLKSTVHDDGVYVPVSINGDQIRELVELVLRTHGGGGTQDDWEKGGYHPTPTIIEAALALYGGHNVSEITRRDASIKNLTDTTKALQKIVDYSRKHKEKAICFVTGVPGAGKTLVGLDIAKKNMDPKGDEYSVYLSGNGPLVSILQEALARDMVSREKRTGKHLRKGEAKTRVKAFIQNVHHFRDECLEAPDLAPPEHVAIFDEAQRAWNLEMTADFMRRKKKRPGFNQSESGFLISCLDRHPDWAVIICLVGGGQEINRGEAGIEEWLCSVEKFFPEWKVYCSPQLVGKEYVSIERLGAFSKTHKTSMIPDLHLGVSVRSFRAAELSSLVNSLLNLDKESALKSLKKIKKKYPILLTRDIEEARRWVRSIARGTERYGIVVSSSAERLKPLAIDVKTPVDPVHWFLADKDDVRSSYYLEDVATEFQVQGLELDWTCVTWDADLRHTENGWEHWSFAGKKWNKVKKEERKRYLENAYRVLLTRARQGMVIVVPKGNKDDPTRSPSHYDSTFVYLKSIGFENL